MDFFTIKFDLKYNNTIKKIDILAYDLILNQDILKITDFTTGAQLEYKTKDIFNLTIKNGARNEK